MYRQPLLTAVKNILNVAASTAAHGKVFDYKLCLARSVVACREARVSSPFLAPCRTLHNTTQLCQVNETPHTQEEVGAFTKLIEAMGFTGPLKYNKWKIKVAALRMYICCAEKINYDDFFERCSLPDTLNSWFLVTQLHVWMCLVRLRQEGRTGKYMCHNVVETMWGDVLQRIQNMGVESSRRNEAMHKMTELFYVAVFRYDEGILSDDSALASALWKNLFSCQCKDPQQLELMVEYVRKQVQYIDALDGEDLLLTGEVNWRPLVEENAQSILKVSAPTYNDAGL